MNDADSVRSAHTAALSVLASVAETMRQVGARDGRLDAELIASTARLAVAAWVMAVNGDVATLAGHSGPDAVHWLLHPVRKPWRVAPGPVVTQIDIWGLDASAEPPRLKVSFRFSGRQLADDPDQGEKTGGETLFAGLLVLTLGDGGQQPWQLASGHVMTLDEFLGYVFTSRRETPEEHRQRTGPAATRPGRRRPGADLPDHGRLRGSRRPVRLVRDDRGAAGIRSDSRRGRSARVASGGGGNLAGAGRGGLAAVTELAGRHRTAPVRPAGRWAVTRRKARPAC